jgi:protein-L-isoaspartate(D-aspartate) O-methyltransferase
MQIHQQSEDTYLHKGRRAQLVQLLKDKGINDSNVLNAINKIPRHYFLDSAFEKVAYENRSFEILAGQTISHPYTVALQTQLLEVKKYDKVLEVGTGSAFQSCVLAELGAKVFTIERQKELYDQIGKFFYLKNFPFIKRFYGDGFEGLPTYAPFDKIIITAGAPVIPEKLLQQLKVGGIMVVPLDHEGNQQMKRITKISDKEIEIEEFGVFDFVPMLEGKVK